MKRILKPDIPPRIGFWTRLWDRLFPGRWKRDFRIVNLTPEQRVKYTGIRRVK